MSRKKMGLRSQQAAIEQGCGNREAHPSLGKAEAAARALAKKNELEYKAYPCSFCGKFHIRRKK